MKRLIALIAIFCPVFSLMGNNTLSQKYQDSKLPVDARVDGLLQQMTLQEKIALLGGDETGFNSCGVERLGIPPIRMSDGPVGVRTGAATAFPVSINMAASWDTGLIHRYGVALGEETKAKGRNCILGPCVGIHRFPLNGRNFESFGEDPFLSSRMAVSVIQGVQSQGVIATVKHFACNDQEWERNHYDVQVDERTLREIHLPAFETAVTEGHVLAVMSAYNIVNGAHCSENRHLLTDILKEDWGFPGIVMSDWVSVYSADKAANAGLDMEMPHPVWFKDRLLAAVQDGRVSEAVIDDKVRRQLRVRFLAGIFDRPAPTEDETIIRSESHRHLALEMARKSIVLLKNDGLLPLAKDRIKTIALIGPHAKTARTGGGGSSMVQPWETVSPYEGAVALLGNQAKIAYAEGTHIDPVRSVPLPSRYLRTPDGRSEGLLGEYFANSRFAGPPVFTRIDPLINFDFSAGGVDPRLSLTDFAVRWTGKFIPPVTRCYRLAISSDDGSRLTINGRLVVDNWGQHGEVTRSCDVPMEAGKEYDIQIDYNQVGGDASMRLGWQNPDDITPEPTIAEAVQVARQSDAVILCVGNTAFLESEGADVGDFKMSGNQDELVQAVAEANPHTVAVVYGGVPVLMQHWLGKVKAVIAALYPGQEGGTALAQILFGEVNPSGKLPFSYLQDRSQSPAFNGYMDPGLKVHYAEGVFVGYRYYDRHKIDPLFPFGYGLSYTTFDYGNLRVEQTGGNAWVVKADIKNSGKMAGEEVVEVYLGPEHCSVPRPLQELKGFSKVSLAPGETGTVSIPLNERAFQFYDPERKQWTLEPGVFEVRVGASSRDIRLKGTIKL